ncbi:MAG TPA: TRAP transporter small permease subunit [Rhizobiales bacterium]|nr:TRAP transporter small permease subunit [Hyphomicrobiales bacterium]
MPEFLKTYVRVIDAASWYMGLFAMYLVYVMIGILGYSSFMKVFFLPPIWSVEMAQFVMVAYFTLGGAFAIREDEHVRMDLLYAGWSVRGKHRADLITGLAMIFFLVMLQVGGIASLIYAFQYGEKGFSAWAPYMAPVKVVINVGLFLTLLQAIATWLKDWARLRGEPIA